MPKSWSEWIAFVGGLVALAITPVTVSQCWQDRARLVLEYDYAASPPIGVEAEHSMIPEISIFPAGSPKPPPKADSTPEQLAIISARNLGRRPLRLEKIELVWIEHVSGPNHRLIWEVTPFRHVLTEENRRATFVARLRARKLLSIRVFDDSGNEHVLRTDNWNSRIAKAINDKPPTSLP